MLIEKENIEMIKKDSKLQSNELNSVLMCQQDSQETQLWIGFGCVSVGSLSIRQFTVINPQTTPTNISISKSLERFGISLTFGDQKETSITLQPGESTQGYITWEPQTNLSLREDIVLNINSSFKLKIRVHGFGGIGAV